VALALQADPAKTLNLGKAANEQVVKTTDLSKYRIIVFATHGLVPGDLNGLMQPALALTAPEVAGVPGDGLLTMERSWRSSSMPTGRAVGLQYRRWSGRRSGGCIGLGRAFFYAGTPRDFGDQLVGAFPVGAGARERSLPPPSRRSKAHTSGKR